jgi:hypothetical protein
MTPVEIAMAPVANIAHVIQLSVAPVFLLSGIGVFLGVLTQRLARVIDRSRLIEEQHEHAAGHERLHLEADLRVMARRGRLISQSITASVSSALAVALVVALIFLSEFIRFPLAGLVSLLFIGAMLALLTGLIAFLIEVRVATAQLRIGKRS